MQIVFTQPFMFVYLGDSRQFTAGDTVSEPPSLLLVEAEGKYQVEVSTTPNRTAPEAVPYSARPAPEVAAYSRGKGK